MGYSIYILDRNRPVTDKELEEMITEMPENLKGHWNIPKITSKKQWGYSLATDVSLRKEKITSYILIHGSISMSGKDAVPTAKFFSDSMKKRGFNPEIYSSDFKLGTEELSKWIDKIYGGGGGE